MVVRIQNFSRFDEVKTFTRVKLLLLFACVFIFFTGCKERIVHDLSEYEANRVVTSLDDIGLGVSKEKQADGKWTVVVPSDSAMLALKHLNSTRVLSNRNHQKVNTASVVSSREDRQFKYERALSAEIESTLRSIGGVFDARVHLNIAPKDPVFGRPLSLDDQGSASVLLIGGEQLTATEEHVARLVYGASGVPIEKISVLISPIKEVMRVLEPDPGVALHPEGDEKGYFLQTPSVNSAANLFRLHGQFALPIFFVLIGAVMLWRLSPFS